jgi:protein phosphatase
VDDRHRGAAVQCGGCGRQFVVPPAASPPSWWGGLKKAYQAITGSGHDTTVDDAAASLELDGPAAGAAESQTGLAAAVVPRFEVGSATSAGRVRPRNEDSFLVQQMSWCNRDEPADVALLAVADGMGGQAGGDLASGLVIRSLAGSLAGLVVRLARLHPGQPVPSPAEVAATVGEAIQAANLLTHQKAQSESGFQGMGAALAVVVAWYNQAVAAHVGDCRIYHGRAGKLVQLTRDQTVVGRMVELGKLTQAEALTHPARNELTQAIGRHTKLEISPVTLPLAADDWLLVACDGLHTHLDNDTIAEAVIGGGNAPRLANDLVRLANRNGGSDNCTVLTLRCRS